MEGRLFFTPSSYVVGSYHRIGEGGVSASCPVVQKGAVFGGPGGSALSLHREALFLMKARLIFPVRASSCGSLPTSSGKCAEPKKGVRADYWPSFPFISRGMKW